MRSARSSPSALGSALACGETTAASAGRPSPRRAHGHSLPPRGLNRTGAAAQRSPARRGAVQRSAAHRSSCDRIDGFESRRCAAPQRSLRLHAAQRCSVARRGTAGSRPIRTHGRFAVPVLSRRKPWRVLEQQRAAVGPVRDRRIVQRRRAVPAAQDATAACRVATAACRAISRHPSVRACVCRCGVRCERNDAVHCHSHRPLTVSRALYIALASRIRSV